MKKKPAASNNRARRRCAIIRETAWLLIVFSAFQFASFAQINEREIPHAPREFRAVWVATVNNIDFPSSPNLTTTQQKAELIKILDRAQELNLNAVIFQVRPQCDAFYQSSIEPWSEYLTGRMGKPPEPFYDPLEFAVREAHRRGLELHAWFNPYRALHFTAKRPPAPEHIAVRRPDLAKVYGRYVWLDPGEREVQDYSLGVVLDVVKRYDIDGVHFDDYFYPYKEKDASGREIPFPDDASWTKYLASGGRLSKADWRRKNVNDFVRRVYQEIKRAKPHVAFGISPFGIWQPGFPAQIKGFNAYEELYADSRLWLREGWVDYLAPQLYWEINREAQSYSALLEWWLKQSEKNRYVFAGNALSRIGSSPTFNADEIINQILVSRRASAPSGNIFFSAKALLQDAGGVNEKLKSEVYAQAALTPPLRWLNDKTPLQPADATLVRDKRAKDIVINWRTGKGENIARHVVYFRHGGAWSWMIVSADASSFRLTNIGDDEMKNLAVAVSSVSRTGIESRRTVAISRK